jgi:uncharacterized membrane protein YwzB
MDYQLVVVVFRVTFIFQYSFYSLDSVAYTQVVKKGTYSRRQD